MIPYYIAKEDSDTDFVYVQAKKQTIKRLTSNTHFNQGMNEEYLRSVALGKDNYFTQLATFQQWQTVKALRPVALPAT